MKNKKEERKRIESVAHGIKYGEGFNGRLMYYRYLTLRNYFKGTTALELGSADGYMTAFLVKNFKRVVAVDGSEAFCRLTRKNVPAKNLEVVCAMFEEYHPSEKFD